MITAPTYDSLKLNAIENTNGWYMECDMISGIAFPFRHIVDHRYVPHFLVTLRRGEPITIEDIKLEQPISIKQFVNFLTEILGFTPTVFLRTSKVKAVPEGLSATVKRIIYVCD
jgi:hypothetical protein